MYKRLRGSLLLVPVVEPRSVGERADGGAGAARFVFPDLIVDWRTYEAAKDVLVEARAGIRHVTLAVVATRSLPGRGQGKRRAQCPLIECPALARAGVAGADREHPPQARLDLGGVAPAHLG